ncbi:MAG: hypothetical protein MZV70_47220 [Desulfobacterales bacterium]|nr:hypothetical protein [Desulfobacterales bacterium]
MDKESPDPMDLIIADRYYRVSAVDLKNHSRVVIIDDVTDVVRINRMAILSDMARKVSHDIKNPLTPIRLNVEYLLSIREKKPESLPLAVCEVASNILKKTEELQDIASQFSDLVRSSSMSEVEPLIISDFLNELLASYPTLQFTISGERARILEIVPR